MTEFEAIIGQAISRLNLIPFEAVMLLAIAGLFVTSFVLASS